MLYEAFNKRIREDDCCLYELFQICKTDVPEAFLDLIVTLINEKVFDLFELKGFKDIGIDEYFKEHMQLILETGQDMIWTKLETCYFILSKYDIEDLLDYFSPTGMVYLSQMIKLCTTGITGLLIRHLQLMFSPDLDKQTLRRRLAKLVRQDQSDLTFLEYAFHRHAVQIIAMLEDIKEQLCGDDGDGLEFYIPQMVKVTVELTEKDGVVVDGEAREMEKAKDLLGLAKEEGCWNELFKAGHGTYVDKVGKEETEKLKIRYDAFKDMAKDLKKEFFRFFKASSATYEYIDKPEQLNKAFDDVLTKQKFVTVDVEFCGMDVIGKQKEDESFRHHIASSLQISTIDQNYFIDCLALKNHCMAPVAKLFGSPDIIKVFHGCESDLDVIYHTFGVMVKNIYDTARAAVVIHSLENTPGLNNLALRYLNVHLDKSFQKSIWRVRPLPLPMLEYAITDSYVLLPIFYHQLIELDGLADVNAKSIEIWHNSNNLPKYIKTCSTALNFL